MSRLEEKEITSNYLIIFGLSCIVGFGLAIRFFYFPNDVPIVTDGYISFVYAVKTVFDGNLAIGYSVVNTGWPYLLSLLFMFFDRTDPLQLMDVQRITSILISSITAIPIFFILRKFTTNKWALFGSFLIVIEPRLVLMSIEGLNYSLFLFLFVSSIALFLKRTNFSLVCCFISIACLALVRYEGILLIIPLSILYFIKFRDKKTTYRYLFMIFIMVIILIPISSLRIQATEDICTEYSFGKLCGDDGITSHVLSGIDFFIRYIVFTEQASSTDLNDDEFHKEMYVTGNSNFIPASQESLYRLVKFIGFSSFPFFGFFILFNLVTRLKARNKINFGFDSKVILFCSAIMILPSLYAYMRGIDEIRYVLVLIPLFCVISISWNKSISKRISKDYIMVLLIISIVIISVLFMEMKQRDTIHDKESFLVSQRVVELTDVINRFYQDGYIKTAVLVHDWPILPEANENGKVTHRFQTVSLNDSENIQKLIKNAKENNLEYLVIDKNNIMFEEARNDSMKYIYLDKIFDSEKLGFKNQFSIYKINYDLFDLKT